METLGNHIDQKWRATFTINRIFSRSSMSRLRIGFGLLALIFIALSGLATFTDVLTFALLWYGLALLFTGLWLEQIMIYAYHNHYYFAGLNSIIGRDEIRPSKITYDVADICLRSSSDITAALFSHPVGQVTLQRVELTTDMCNEFLGSARTKISAYDIALPQTGTFSAIDLGMQVIAHDPEFAKFLLQHRITPEYWQGALRWTATEHIQNRLNSRWWSKAQLLKTSGIGKHWSYGYTNLLNQFLKPTRTSAVFSVFSNIPRYAELKVDELSDTLLQEKAGNVLLLGEAGVGKTDVVIALERRIASSKSIAGLQHKRIATLDTERLLAVHETATSFEQTFLQLLQEATAAGNTIMLIENISNFITTAHDRGVHIPELLDTYLAHPDIQFIATDTPGAFHTILQPLGGLVRRFGQVVIDTPDTESVVRILQQSSQQVSARHQVMFTYPALVTIAQGAQRYITDGVPPDSALTLLVEVAQHGTSYVTAATVQDYLKEKTGIPMGDIDEAERDVLLHLEDTLHQHVIGQDAAIDAISKTIRRSRVGIQTTDRPIGSFLFLGPTGVGKTETAKTLAAVFFGSEANMLRFDMSEFSGTNALTHLIGGGQDSGVLSQALHDHPYTVLLLDEFEKADRSVHDLFLQILDEGLFTDGRGTQVNARNTIIIATANAGSELIYKTRQQRSENPTLNQNIIDHIVETGQFRPELINRFDNTIIFEPLLKNEQLEIAKLMLQDLRSRLHEKSYELTFAPDVYDYLLEHGYSDTFGARAMRREIQDTIEAVIADKIIADGLQIGDTLTLTRADLEKTKE